MDEKNAEWASKNETAIRHVALQVRSQLKPARPDQILTAVEKLQSRYWRGETEYALARELALEWIEDLSEYPHDMIAEAARRWRKNPKRGYSPASAGVLMEPVLTEYRERLQLRRVADDALDGARAYVPVQHISDDERAKVQDMMDNAVAKLKGKPKRKPVVSMTEKERDDHKSYQLRVLRGDHD